MKKRNWLLMGFISIITVATVVPALAAITRFTDVPDTNIFAGDIKWMDDNEITSGCGTDLYCPKDNVTREQMAAFMHRLATKRVVDAADSDLVDGMNATDLTRVAAYTFETPKEPDDFARIESFDITAPVNGYLVLSSSLQYQTDSATETIWCALALNGTQVPGSASSNTVKTATPVSGGTCAAEGVVAVTAGSHSITIMGFYSDLLETTFQWGTASALFVPFNGAGSQPASFTVETPVTNQLP